MTTLNAHKMPIYPKKEVANLINQFFGARRFIYNHFRGLIIENHANGLPYIGAYGVDKLITELKTQPEFSWLKLMDDWALKSASADLHQAFINFFKSCQGKRKGKKSGHPQRKKKHGKQSYRTRGSIKFNDDFTQIKLPKLGWIDIKCHREIKGKFKSVTVSRDKAGTYWASVLIEEETHKLLPQTGKQVGIDIGLKDLMVLSTGQKISRLDNELAKAKRDIKKAQRRLSRTVKGSKNREKARIKLARAHRKHDRIKKWWHHNLSRWLVNNFDSIYMEDLNISGMMKNRKLARVIHDASWTQLVTFIRYKADRAGRLFHQTDRWFASTKTCHNCGHKMDEMPLEIRDWVCPSCCVHHDRDLNAAINMLQRGQIDCYEQILPSAEPVEVGPKVPTSINRVFSSVSEFGVMPNPSETDVKTKVPLETGCHKKHSGLSVEVDTKSRLIFS